jgi:hypothetical protein
MGTYGEILEDFYAERTRILEVLALEDNKHVIMRLIGALAFRTQCPKFGYIQDRLERKFTDIDFASYPRFNRDIRRILTALGYEEDKQVTQLFGTGACCSTNAFGRHIDIFFKLVSVTCSFSGAWKRRSSPSRWPSCCSRRCELCRSTGRT